MSPTWLAAKALRECRRVLAPGGAMVFTVPVTVGRETRSRLGLPDVFHGDTSPPYRSLVHTDFGSDLWSVVLDAGFDDFRVVAAEVPSGVAYVAREAR